MKMWDLQNHFLCKDCLILIFFPRLSALVSGVIPAPILSIFDLFSIGSSSKYRQYVCSRLANVSFVKVGKSYFTSSGPKQSSQTYLKAVSYSFYTPYIVMMF